MSIRQRVTTPSVRQQRLQRQAGVRHRVTGRQAAPERKYVPQQTCATSTCVEAVPAPAAMPSIAVGQGWKLLEGKLWCPLCGPALNYQLGGEASERDWYEQSIEIHQRKMAEAFEDQENLFLAARSRQVRVADVKWKMAELRREIKQRHKNLKELRRNQDYALRRHAEAETARHDKTKYSRPIDAGDVDRDNPITSILGVILRPE